MVRCSGVKDRSAASRFAVSRIGAERIPNGGEMLEIERCSRERLRQSAGRDAFVARVVFDGAHLLLNHSFVKAELLHKIRGKTSAKLRFRNYLHILRGGLLMHGSLSAVHDGDVGLQLY